MRGTESVSITPGGVEEYISGFPREVQDSLKKIRAAIRAVAPGSIETVSYFQMPGYSYPGYHYNGMFAWFSYKKPHVRLHVRPPVLQDHRKELAGYRATRAIISFPTGDALPVALVKKLVRASLKEMKKKSAELPASS